MVGLGMAMRMGCLCERRILVFAGWEGSVNSRPASFCIHELEEFEGGLARGVRR